MKRCSAQNIALLTGYKKCSKCKKVKSIDEFACRLGKLNCACKLCINTDQIERSRLNGKKPRHYIRDVSSLTGFKFCVDCNTYKLIEEFHKACRVDREDTDRAVVCKKCTKRRWVVWYVKSEYGISLEEYAFMLLEQDFKCKNKACRNPITVNGLKGANVDHHHASGTVRGLLCAYCNKGIGHFKDSPALLRGAADYIEGRI